MMVEIGVDRMHHGFWKYIDPAHPQARARQPARDAILDYYRMVDGRSASCCGTRTKRRRS